ncbi:MAG: class I SAM-dependent methyltransferase [bacterium]
MSIDKQNQNDTKHCIVCDAEAVRTFKGMSGYVDGTLYDVYECTSCLTSFVDPMSNLKEEYDIIYGKDATKDSATDYYYYLAHGVKKLRNPLKDLGNYSAIFWGVVRALKDKRIKQGSKILENGSGLGYLTYACNKARYVCEGLDCSKTAIDFAKSFYGGIHTQGTIEDFAKNHEGVYDVVIATEVIEHIVDPNIFIENSLKILKPGGVLIFTTPIKDIHPKGTIWETEPAPVHLWWFTEKGIASIAKRFNTEAQFVDFTEYTKNKIWNVHTGTAHTPPNKGPVVDKKRHFITRRKKGYKEMVMRILPAWMYIKIVCLYHNLKFLQRDTVSTRYMYGMCVIIEKP